MQKIILYVKFRTSRLEYIAPYIFETLLGLELILTQNIAFFQRSSAAKINYSQQDFTFDCLHIIPHQLLQHDRVEAQEIVVRYENSMPFFFQTSDTTVFKSDILAASFYLLSRYEEYLPFQADQHGRFAASESLAYRAGFLQRPMVQEWANLLQIELKKLFPDLIFQSPNYQFQPTFDIDIAWAYQQRPLWRSVGANLRDLKARNWQQARQRWRTNRKQEPDVYDVFEELRSWHEQPLIYFFLLADYNEYDKNIDWQNPQLQQLIQRLNETAEIGIHPSYQSNKEHWRISLEINRLKQIIAQPILKSRQHFLKLHLPTTYQNLIINNILEDYSMGYADAIGFRASTAHSFLWFDLSSNEVSNLRIHPFQVMDVTLKSYLQLTPEKAKKEIEQLIKITQRFGGTFISLWHNSSFSVVGDWEDWKAVYQYLLALAQEEK